MLNMQLVYCDILLYILHILHIFLHMNLHIVHIYAIQYVMPFTEMQNMSINMTNNVKSFFYMSDMEGLHIRLISRIGHMFGPPTLLMSGGVCF